ncbi:cysteine hydrolase [Nocardiopsis sp. MG754419]|nr:cysteine hydrolase [Nocardiopsis sp. MG754419]
MLVVVDVQEGFLNHHSRPVLPTLVRLLDTWTRAGRPLVLTRYLNHADSPFSTLLDWTRLQAPPETDLASQVNAHADDAVAVIDKHGYSCCTDAFLTLVDRHGWTDTYFCGIATESCVLKSAADAFELGLVPRIITDASSSDAGARVHRAGLTVARRLIGAHHLVTTDQVCARVDAEPSS